MQIILIRHGQSKGNESGIVQGHTDFGLSNLGIKQAELLSSYFNVDSLNYIYSSDLNRAIQTAEPTAKKLNLEINIEKDLREADFGIWEGMTYDGVKESYPNEYNAWHKNYFIRPSWFESFEGHLARMKNIISKLLQKHSNADKLGIFTHGGSIKTQVGYFQHLTGEELSKISISNCSLTHIEFDTSKIYEKGELVYYNKTYE